MTDTLSIIRQVFAECGMPQYAEGEKGEKFAVLFDELIAFNNVTNLTAITECEEVALRHFADSLTAADKIPVGATVIDVGCGGGFPTLPLAIARPDLAITALDSTAKKLVFVENMARKLSLNVKTLAARAEEIPECREAFDVATSRAVARMNLLTELCLPLVKVGGKFVAMKGASGKEELSEAEGGIVKLGGSVTGVDAFTLLSAGERVIITVDKIAPTPSAYPRPWGKIKKKPL